MTNPTTVQTGWMGDPSRGAAMGRPSGVVRASELPPRSVYLSKVKLTDGYDDGGAYWGIGQPLYCAYSDDYCEYCEYVRADSRVDAVLKLGLIPQQLKKPLSVSDVSTFALATVKGLSASDFS